MFIPGSSVTVLCFEIIVAAVVIALIAATRHAYRTDPPLSRKVTMRVFLGLLVWLGGLLALIKTEAMVNLPLNGMPIFFGSVLLVSLAVGLSPFGARLARNTPIAALVAFQAFRLPLELVLHRWAERGTIPTTMTWTGQNWDIVAGALAFVIWPIAKNRNVAWTFNILGSLLLLNVVRVALLSSPVPFGWNTEPPLQLFLHAPYFLIGPVLVGGAIAGHIILTRALLREPTKGATT